LIHDPIEILSGVEIVVSLEYCRNVVAHQQLVNRHCPAGAVLLEAFGSIHIPATPLVEGREFNPSTGGLVPAEQVVDEDELKPGPTLLQSPLEPTKLLEAQ
jgi:hypothetical protein